MSVNTHCKGCGATLQISDQEKVGYAISLAHDYCQACFKLVHYGESHDHFHPEDLPELKKDALIVMVSSVLHLDMLFEYPVYRYQSEATYIYLINQIDLLPKQTNLDFLLQRVIEKARIRHIPYHDIIMMSAINPADLERLKAYLRSFKKDHIYLIGVQNSGKTTLFKALTDDAHALSMKKAGLTQEPLIRPFGHHTLLDMPGLFQKGYIHEFLSYDTYKKLIPDKEIKPRIYQMRAQQSLMIEKMIGLTPKDEKAMVLYLSDHVHIHKTNPVKMDLLLTEIKEGEKSVQLSNLVKQTYKIQKGKQQITLADIGFIHLEGPTTLEIIAPKRMHITVTEALFK